MNSARLSSTCPHREHLGSDSLIGNCSFSVYIFHISNIGRDYVSYFSILYGNLRDKIIIIFEYCNYCFIALKTRGIFKIELYL